MPLPIRRRNRKRDNDMDEKDRNKETERIIVETLKEIYDPELPVNIYDLGLIYEINIDDRKRVKLVMTLTAPNCPMADQLVEEIDEKLREIPGVEELEIEVVFDPPWDKSMLSDEARLELGLM